LNFCSLCRSTAMAFASQAFPSAAIKGHKSQHSIEINQPFIINTSQCLLSKGLFIVLLGAEGRKNPGEPSGICEYIFTGINYGSQIGFKVEILTELPTYRCECVCVLCAFLYVLASSLSKSHYLLIRIQVSFQCTKHTERSDSPTRSFICRQLKAWKDTLGRSEAAHGKWIHH